MKRSQKTNTRERLLDAAESVVIEQGVSAMTLEAVAARAGVSKGGLLYHFPSKDAVVMGMVSRIASIVQERFAFGLANEAPGPGQHAKALLHMLLDTEGSLAPRLQRVAGPLLGAASSNPKMLEPIQQFFRGVHQGMLDDGFPVDRSWLVLAALDGLKYWKIFGILHPSEQDLAALRRLLTQIIDEASL
ncbi:TetR/AcrR family transcriptional regulator [Methylomonas sp. UP202]|uniref:TetR/AcrR family transcriptional regulator n=1 Tax=Methylomonas sp. UP202 TaxID=3040943 RepID=UPI00247A531E|nr:TetR/AcrR family transcriptional regulator [Methylomonas sp. UP202]WGS84024.1 TetR/AcrR family transcriptional regulator [Methylomonas sp. UP202]